MAADKLKYSDLDSGALDQLIANLREAKKEYDNLIESQKEVLKQSNKLAQSESKVFDNVEKIKNTEEAIQKVEKAVKELDTLEKQRLKTEKALLELDDERAKQNAILAEQLKAKRKALREEAKAATELDNAYKNLTKKTNEAQAEFKKLAVQFGINSKEAREAGKNFDKLDAQLREVNDAARDGRRDVGRYQLATEKLNNSLKKFGVGAGAILVITKAFEGLQNVIGNNAEAGAGLEKVLGSVTVSFTVLLSRIVKAFPIFINIVKDGFNSLTNGFKESLLELKIFWAETKSVFGSGSEEINKLKKELALLQKESKGSGATFDDLTGAFKGMGDEIVSTIEKNNRLIDSTLASRKAVITYQETINGLLKTQAQQQAAADNENNSLLDRIKSQKELQKTTALINIEEKKIAAERVKLAEQNLGVFNQSIDAREALAQANTDFIALEVEQEAERQAQLTELSTLEADVLEQRLDFLIDNFDNQKTINERIIADEKSTFEERQRLLAQNEKLSIESYDAQLQAFNERLAEQGKGQLDFEKLVNESDSRLIAQEALNAGLSERLTTRLLEVIRERRTVIQDNVEATNDLNDATKDSNDLEKETILNTEILNKLKEDGVDVELVLQQLEEKRLSLEIQNLQTRIALAKVGSEERIKLEKDLSEKLLEEQQARLEKEKEKEEKAAEKRKEIQEGVASFLEKLNQKVFDNKISKLDEEIDKEKEREDQLRELARQGVQDAENNLAVTQKRQAELEREREQALKRQKAFELGLAAARAYSANVATGDGNALVKTITDISLLEAFIDNLAGFYEGTDLVKNDLNPTVKGKDGYVIRVDGDERIFNPAQNKAVSSLGSNLNNWELVRLAQVGKSLDSQTSNLGDSAAVLQGLNSVKRAIESKPVNMGIDYDKIQDSLTYTYQQKGRITKKHYKKAQGFLSKPD
jgi:hypothetical protein